MIGSSKVLRLITIFGVCWAGFTWLFVAYPFQEIIISRPIHNNIIDHQNTHTLQPPPPKSSSSSSSWQQQQTRGQQQQQDDDDSSSASFSACLLVMDDSHWLIEWLAYHYHSLPLRRLIVGVDPRSETSPTPVLDRWKIYNLDITEWNKDEDYTSEQELMDAERRVRMNFGNNLTDSLVRHRARQRIFYYKCMKQLKLEGKTWTLMTDTDEFLRINVRTAKDLFHVVRDDEESFSSSSSIIQQHIPTANEPSSIRTMLQLELQRPGSNITKSPCIQIPRLRFGVVPSGKPPMSMIPDTRGLLNINPDNFMTLHWRKHASPQYYWANRISKVMIDISKVSWDELRAPVESIHRPIKSLCSQKKLHIRSPDSVFVINHYLGSWEQYQYRSDARITDARFGEHRSRKQYNKDKVVDQGTNDDIRPWLKGFVETMGVSNARSLLYEVGVLQPKNKDNNNNNNNNDDDKRVTTAFMPQQATDKERCAILFFGLPRSYKDLVLPSIKKNIIGPNERYNCDYFVHYYYRTEEPSGRANKGGKLDPTEILLLEEMVLKGAAASQHRRKVNHNDATSNNKPVVEFVADTEDDFWTARKATVQKYRNTKSSTGRLLYFPWKARTYEYPKTMDNIVRQWHSINGVWELMEQSAAKLGVHYTRIGMFRSDALYVTPIDIYESELGVYDKNNNQAMLAPFGAMPVNDRMFYGPHDAVEIWATKRFSFLESYAHRSEPGWAMHSEKFLNGAIMPAIRELGISIVVNPDICFLRTRADYSTLMTDCHLTGQTRGFDIKEMRSKVEQVLDRQCSNPYKITQVHIGVKCEPSQSFQNKL